MPTFSTDLGFAPSSLQFCPKCYPNPSIGLPDHPPGKHPDFPWAMRLVCRTCHCKFTLCTVCTNQRIRLTTSELRHRHHHRCHVIRETAIPIPPLQIQVSSMSTTSALNTDSSSLQSRLTADPHSNTIHLSLN